MNRYRVYPYNSNNSTLVEAKYPQEAVIEFVAKAYNADKKAIQIAKVNNPMKAAVEQSNVLGFIAAGSDGLLNFYVAKFIPNSSQSKGSKTSTRTVYMRCRGVGMHCGPFVDATIYTPKNARNALEYIGNILEQMVKSGAIQGGWQFNGNIYYNSTKSGGGSDYDDPEIYITGNGNTMSIKVHTSRGSTLMKEVPLTDSKTLELMLGHAEMLNYCD